MIKKSASLLFAFLIVSCSKPAPQTRPDLARKGELAPRLALSGLLNAPVPVLNGIEDLKDKVVVLEFWATWCEPCVDNIPRYNSLAEKFRDKPVVFIAITDEAEDAVSEFLRKTPIKGWIAPGAGADVFRAYRVFGRPHTVVVGRDSKVAAVTFPSEVSEERLNLLLAGQAPSFKASIEDPAIAAGSAPALAEFYLGEPLSGETTAEYGRGYYAAHNSPLFSALDYFYRDVRKIDASAAALAVLGKRYELRIRLPRALAAAAEEKVRGDDGLVGFLEAGLEHALGLRFRTVKKKEPVYLLKPAHGGAKGFKKSGSGKGSVHLDGVEFKAEKMPVSALCGMLKDKVNLPLIDESGLKGEYDYVFRSGPGELALINTALIDQLGLRLLPATRLITVLEVR